MKKLTYTQQMCIDLIQDELKKWLDHNFPDSTADQQFFGIVEEVGELSHAELKHKQGIRGYNDEKAMAEIKDAVGDIAIYLINYCNRKGIVFADCVEIAYNEIMKRDWQENKNTGVGE